MFLPEIMDEAFESWVNRQKAYSVNVIEDTTTCSRVRNAAESELELLNTDPLKQFDSLSEMFADAKDRFPHLYRALIELEDEKYE